MEVRGDRLGNVSQELSPLTVITLFLCCVGYGERIIAFGGEGSGHRGKYLGLGLYWFSFHSPHWSVSNNGQYMVTIISRQQIVYVKPK